MNFELILDARVVLVWIKMKHFRMLFIAFAVGQAYAQDLSAPVTLDTGAMRLEAVAKEISKLSGARLGVSPDLAGEPVILIAKKAPAKEVMDRLASVLTARWRKDTGGWTLERTAQQSEQLMARSIEYHESALRASLEHLRERASKDGPFTTEVARSLATEYAHIAMRSQDERDSSWFAAWREMEGRLPGDRAVVALLSLIPLRELSQIQPGQRLVFSDKPTRMQRALPNGAMQVLDQLAKDISLFATEVRRALPMEKEPARVTHRDPRLADTSPVRMVLILQNGEGQQLSATLYAVDERNRPVATGRAAIGVFAQTNRKYRESMAEQAKLRGKEARPIPLSHLSTLLIDRFKAAKDGDAPLPPDLRKALLAPDQYEPLDLLLPDLMRAWSEAENANVVAWLPDSALMLAISVAQGREPTLSAFRTGLDTLSLCDTRTEDGWISLSPADPQDAMVDRLDREELADFLACFWESGSVTLESSSDLVRSYKRPAHPILFSVWRIIIGSELHDASQNSLHALRIYGALTKDQRASLNRGESISWHDLHPVQQRSLAEYLFSEPRDHVYTYIAEEGAEVMEEMGRERHDNSRLSFRTEPTEYMPDGVPSDVRISAKETKAHVFFATLEYAGGSKYKRPMSESDIAWLLYSQEVEPANAMAISEYVPGFQRQVELSIRVTKNHGRRTLLNESVSSSAKPVSFDQLPEQTRKKVLESLDSYRKNQPLRQRDQQKPPAFA